MSQVIEKFINLDLFNLLSKVRTSYIQNMDINESNVMNIQDYDESSDVEIIPDEKAVLHVYNPSKSRYNIVWGLTETGQVVFISRIDLNLEFLILERIRFQIKLVESDAEVEFSIPGNLTYTDHEHKGRGELKEINKFTAYISELTDDNYRFSKGKILSVNLNPELSFSRDLMVESNLSKLNEVSGIYGVDFRFELNPIHILKRINDPNFDISDPRCNLTYRSNVICYRDKLGRYQVLAKGLHWKFDSPITLIDENYAVGKSGKVYNINYNMDLNPQIVNLVIYRSAYIISGETLIKVI